MYIKSLHKFSMADVALAGGKGASLGDMRRAGFPIPDGFVITTDAFKEFHKKSFSKNFKSEVLKEFDKFDSIDVERVAVRSSAVAEDSSTASWAGQLESYLNVTKEDLLEKIRLCFKSIESDRVQSYVKDKNIKNEDLAVAVIVQAMVDSKISGVMFTSNPINGNPNEIVIESSYGLGEYIVQGIITPDNFVLDKNTLQIKNKNLGSKEKMYTYRDEKNESIIVPSHLRHEFSLTDEQIKKLADHGKKIEKHYGFPCDIEWAFATEMLSIVQCRPITTL